MSDYQLDGRCELEFTRHYEISSRPHPQLKCVFGNGFDRSFLLTAGLLLSGCKQESKVATGGDPTGVYALVTVNGNKVPASVSHDGVALQVRSGTFTIKADGTCSTKTSFVPPSGPEATREVSATYTNDGSKLTMQWQGAGITTGSIEGNTFTMDNEGMVFVYRK